MAPGCSPNISGAIYVMYQHSMEALDDELKLCISFSSPSYFLASQSGSWIQCTHTVFTGKTAAGGGGYGALGKDPPAVAELLPEVTPT